MALALLALGGIGGAGVMAFIRRRRGGSAPQFAADDPIESELQRILAEESRASAGTERELFGAGR